MFKPFGTLLLSAGLVWSSACSQADQDSTTKSAPISSKGALSGIYTLVADDSDTRGYDSQKNWTPALHEYQQRGFNTLFLTFIRPDTMEVPPAFANLARSKGSSAAGAIPKDTRVIFAIGGIAYSTSINPWPWLTSEQAAKDMAKKVAQWPEQYGADGIDLDIEDGAGDAPLAGANLIAFVKELKRLKPKILVTLPVYGYPQIKAANELVNAAFGPDGTDHGLLDGVGIMVYEGTQALDYVGNYAKIPGKNRWDGFPITAAVPKHKVVVGLKGTASDAEIRSMADAIKAQGLGGFMVWYGSLLDGGQTALQYPPSWDSSTIKTQEWSLARQKLGDAIVVPGPTPTEPGKDPQPKPEPEHKPEPKPDPVDPNKPETPSAPGGNLTCKGVGPYSALAGIAQWCSSVCKAGFCTATHCACE